MYSYKITKNGKTICLGVTDVISDALNILPGGKHHYKKVDETDNDGHRKRSTYKATGYTEDVYVDPSGKFLDDWVMTVTHDVKDIIDILFEEIQEIWSK